MIYDVDEENKEAERLRSLNAWIKNEEPELQFIPIKKDE
jgi:hypothetical protein